MPLVKTSIPYPPYDIDQRQRGYMVQSATGDTYHTLTVSDVERLAKAGVATSFDQIANRVMPDAPEMKRATGLHMAIIERWQLSRKHSNEFGMMAGSLFPYPTIAAHHFKDKIYVFICHQTHEPVILTDEAHLYPSDALMAKLHLLEEVAPK